MSLSSTVWISFLPLVGLVIGWLLNEFSVARKLRSERRKPFGRAMVHLLEAHHYLFLYEVCRRLGEKADASLVKNMMRDAKFSAHKLTPPPEGLELRYTEAIEQIAEISPLLAFELRDKIKIRSIYQQMREGLGAASKEGDDLTEVLGDIVVKRALPHYEKLLLELAKYFGREEHRRLRYHFEAGQRRLESVPETYR